jgi:hypothetical protein
VRPEGEEDVKALGDLVSRIATTLMKEFGFDGVLLKIHVGAQAAMCGITAKEKPSPALDDIVLGECNAVSEYAARAHGAREIQGSIHLPQKDGTHLVAYTGEGKTGES